MMIEQRARKHVADNTCDNKKCTCGCSSCYELRAVLDILNSEPPIVDGFQSVKGLPLSEAPDGSSGRPMGTDTYVYTDVYTYAAEMGGVAQGYIAERNERENRKRAGFGMNASCLTLTTKPQNAVD